MSKSAKDWQTSRFLPEAIRNAPANGTCKWCRGPLPPRRRSFCGEACVHEWCLRTNSGYLRQNVLKRDKGVCVKCGLDTKKRKHELLVLRSDERKARLDALEITESQMDRSFWEADHILGVAEGGGCAGLENIQTLCLWCHRAKTKTAAKKRRKAHK